MSSPKTSPKGETDGVSSVAPETRAPPVVVIQLERANRTIGQLINAECKRNQIQCLLAGQIDIANEDASITFAANRCELLVVVMQTVEEHDTMVFRKLMTSRVEATKQGQRTIVLAGQPIPNPLESCEYIVFADHDGELVVVDDKGREKPLSSAFETSLRRLKAKINSKRHPQLQKLWLAFSDKRLTSEERELQREQIEKHLKRYDVTEADLGEVLQHYREFGMWNASIELMDKMKRWGKSAATHGENVQLLWAFALNRRNKDNDRQKALDIASDIVKSISQSRQEAIDNNESPNIEDTRVLRDTHGLMGRINKDAFIETFRKDDPDYDSCERAIESYDEVRKIDDEEAEELGVKFNFYGAINLLTMLYCSKSWRKRISRCEEIRNIITKAFTNRTEQYSYWDLASVVEANLISFYLDPKIDALRTAVKALKEMQKSEILPWMAETSSRNFDLIYTISEGRKRGLNVAKTPESTFLTGQLKGWLEFLKDFGSSLSPVDKDCRTVLLEDMREGEGVIAADITIAEPDGNRPAKVTVTRHGMPDTDEKTLVFNIGDIDDIFFVRPEAGNESSQLWCRAELLHNYRRYHIVFTSQHFRSQFREKCAAFGYKSKVQNEGANQNEFTFKFATNDQDDKILLGRGTFANVFKGVRTDDGSNDPLAIKVFEDTFDEKLVEQEKEIARQRLAHRNVVYFHGFFRMPDASRVVVMELVTGGTVHDLVDKFDGLLHFTEYALDYARGAANGLAFLHDRAMPIIHKDIKPDNILVNMFTGNVKLIDFNISNETGAIHNAPTIDAGNAHFKAPDAQSVPSSDIFSLGHTIYFMLSGNLPFQAMGIRTIEEYRQQQEELVQELPVEWDSDIKDIIKRCTETDEKSRPTAKKLVADLTAVINRLHEGSSLTRNTLILEDEPIGAQADEFSLDCDLSDLLSTNAGRKLWKDRLQSKAASLPPHWEDYLEHVCNAVCALLKNSKQEDNRETLSMLASEVQKWIQSLSANTNTKKEMILGQKLKVRLRNLVTFLEENRSENRKSIVVELIRQSKMPPHNVFHMVQSLKSVCDRVVEVMHNSAMRVEDGTGKKDEQKKEEQVQQFSQHLPAPASAAVPAQLSKRSKRPKTDWSSCSSLLDASFEHLLQHHQQLIDDWRSSHAMLASQMEMIANSYRPRRCNFRDAAPSKDLLSFLRELGDPIVPEDVARVFASEGITLDVLLNSIEKDDLRDLDLAIGERARVWKAICERRSSL